MNEPNASNPEEELLLATRYCQLSEAGYPISDALDLASRCTGTLSVTRTYDLGRSTVTLQDDVSELDCS